MKAAAAIMAVFLAAVPEVLAAGNQPAGTGGGPSATRLLPVALDRYYPPVAEQPVYLFGMLSLETSFSGIVVDLMEDDIEGARGSFADFRRLYEEAAGMVPEWKELFPVGKVKELGLALAAGDKALAMNAFGALGKVCRGCHAATMVPVQQEYRWGNMGALIVEDPLSGVATGYSQFKRYIKALMSQPVDAEKVSGLTRKIGSESCAKCHLVHVPAALTGTSRR